MVIWRFGEENKKINCFIRRKKLYQTSFLLALYISSICSIFYFVQSSLSSSVTGRGKEAQGAAGHTAALPELGVAEPAKARRKAMTAGDKPLQHTPPCSPSEPRQTGFESNEGRKNLGLGHWSLNSCLKLPKTRCGSQQSFLSWEKEQDLLLKHLPTIIFAMYHKLSP